MKKFMQEFKTFITRGNVIDMAVGVIVGSSFTAIVNGLSNNILKPCINFMLMKILGSNSLSEVYTMLNEVRDETGAIDLTQSIYIDWGAFINAIINFILIAFVLFTMVKIINGVRARQDAAINEKKKNMLTKEDKKAMKAKGMKPSDKEAVKAYLAEKEAQAAEAQAAEEEKARLEREANPTTEDLLKKILALMEKQA